MFENLSNQIGGVFDRLKGRGALSQADIDEGLREVRLALLEADVALPVVKEFIAQVREGACGEKVVKSVTPGQMVVKIVHDHLVETLGGEGVALDLAATPPVALLLAGLQGSGKTTTCAKIALDLLNKQKKKSFRYRGSNPGLRIMRPKYLPLYYTLGVVIEYNRKCPPWGANPRPYG